jgi:hypothetical protein
VRFGKPCLAGTRIDVATIIDALGAGMTGDNPVSMPHGPVLSTTYDHMNGALPSAQGGWESWIADREGHLVDLRSRAQVKIPESLGVWSTCGSSALTRSTTASTRRPYEGANAWKSSRSGPRPTTAKR